MRIAGRMIVPKGSTWATGFNVRRPARLAVSSPNMRATQPWDTSCRMTEGIRTAKKMRSKRLRCTAAARLLALGCAVDAVAGGRLGLEAGGCDGLTAVLANAVTAALELAQCVLHFAQR